MAFYRLTYIFSLSSSYHASTEAYSLHHIRVSSYQSTSLLLCLLSWAEGEGGVCFLTACSSFSSVSIFIGLGECEECNAPALGLLVREVLWAEGQQCWFRHMEQRGFTGRHICWPKPTNSQLISLHSSLYGVRTALYTTVR